MNSALRPRNTPGLSLRFLADTVVPGSGADAGADDDGTDAAATVPDIRISGVTLRAQDAEPGDLFAALPGATAHGAQFTPAALEAGAAAVFTDPDGLATIHRLLGDPAPVPVLVAWLTELVRFQFFEHQFLRICLAVQLLHLQFFVLLQ